MSRFIRISSLAVLVLGICAERPVLAQSPEAVSNATGYGGSDIALEGLQPLAKTSLSQFAGGTAIDDLSIATNTSTVTGNSIGNIGSTGAVGGNVVSGTSGLTTLIANSGNQVVISQSTVVNVYLH